MTNSVTRQSKFLSLVLRHKPQLVDITLDQHGWVAVAELLDALSRHGRGLSFEKLVYVVETNDKRRFSFNEDRTRIRASQGHSVNIDLDYKPLAPPSRLYHGTVSRFVSSIREQGLIAGNRRHVHLSDDRNTARTVGARRGRPVILTIDAHAMHSDGFHFFLADNGVWLTDAVSPQYIVAWS